MTDMDVVRDRFHRLVHFEYWPAWAFYFPVLLVWPFLSWRGKSFLFFTRANPAIPNGGCFGESKKEILQLLPSKWQPKSKFISDHLSLNELNGWLEQEKVAFPFVAKPDMGERGDNIEIVHSLEEVRGYQRQLRRPFILQEYVDSPHEYGVMVVRSPKNGNLEITSIVKKRFLSITGDGVKNLQELVDAVPRARFQWARLRGQFNGKLILAKGESFLLEPIGNHKRGTTFLNANHLLTPELQSVFDEITQNLKGFHFGRFDLKASSEEDFKLGRGIKLLELNGAFSEPGHIYDPSETLWKAWRDLVDHWLRLADVARENKELGHKDTGLKDFLCLYQNYRKMKKNRVPS